MAVEVKQWIAEIIPDRMKSRPVNKHGYPVPWFVTVKNDVTDDWDFRFITTYRQIEALTKKICWICGNPLGVHLSFVLGPVSFKNKVSVEMPQHFECSKFAVKACPFMINPKAERRTKDNPEGLIEVQPGKMLEYNPGLAVVYVTKSFQVVTTVNGLILNLGPEEKVEYYTKGRPATLAEIEEVMNRADQILEELRKEENVDLEV